MPDPVYLRTTDDALVFGNDALELRFDKSTGSWLGLTDRRTGREVVRNPDHRPTCTVVSGGREVTTSVLRNEDDPPLADEARYPADRCLGHTLVRGGDGDTLILTRRAGPWLVREEWHLHPQTDIVRWSVTVTWDAEGTERLRHIIWSVPSLAVGPAAQTTYEAPGLPIAPHRPLSDIPAGFRMKVGDAPAGCPGLVGLADRRTGQVALVWPYSTTEATIGNVYREGEGIRIEQRILLADELARGEGVSGGAQYIRVNSGGWDAALRDFHGWYAAVGLVVPRDRPAWTETASLYELHIGKTVVALGPYEPLPEMRDLLALLPYIKSLGFDTIQIMPHQFFPSYSIHDYYDISTQYGDEATLREVIKTAHSMGIRVILDLVIHGCNDKVVARKTYERSGHQYPEWFERWLQVAADRNPYLDSHPEWFMLDEEGEIRAVYTWAFDHLNDSYQRYLIDVLRYYLVDLGADGFRVDAPTWNFFPNWKKDLPYRAGDCYYGWAQLFARARPALKPHKPDAMFYGEGTGPLYVRDFDIRYDYDQQWLYPAIFDVVDPKGYTWSGQWAGQEKGRYLTARQMAEWLHERRLAHPPGSVLAHHIDSHDSYWPLGQFRREAFGPDAWRPAFAMCALIDGCIMHYIGGEKGNEDFTRRVMLLRRQLPEMIRGTCDYLAVRPDNDMVFAPLRSDGVLHTIPVMNFGKEATRVRLGLPVDAMALAVGRYRILDALNDRLLSGPGGQGWSKGDLANIELELPPFGVAVLVLRPE